MFGVGVAHSVAKSAVFARNTLTMFAASCFLCLQVDAVPNNMIFSPLNAKLTGGTMQKSGFYPPELVELVQCA